MKNKTEAIKAIPSKVLLNCYCYNLDYNYIMNDLLPWVNCCCLHSKTPLEETPPYHNEYFSYASNKTNGITKSNQ